MMKRIFSLTLAAYALALGSAKADNPQIVIQSTHAEEDARAAAADLAAYNKTLAPFFEQLAAQAATPHDPKIRALYFKWLARNGRLNAETQRVTQIDPLTEGDPIPQIANLYDDEATIRLYLHDSGFTDISDIQITNIRTYMHAHGIRHVSELGQ